MCSWQVAVPFCGPWAWPLIIIPHEPQMPSRQSCSKAMGSSPLAISRSLTMSSISRNDISGLMSLASSTYVTICPSWPGAWRQTWRVMSMVGWGAAAAVSPFAPTGALSVTVTCTTSGSA